ncbi:hypothetical protein AK812_SmicGene8992 [Symbiodinium microadriaticum]|uniref:Uncharacterized protein n=1 Tax=Symbiodinium microadriaticum TaxID=2951 RepID=A0A1Q9EJL2_SYMMI|nr:hypothetical protein AK812_SmicGene8992 [Symbiodinium microadriaticum]
MCTERSPRLLQRSRGGSASPRRTSNPAENRFETEGQRMSATWGASSAGSHHRSNHQAHEHDAGHAKKGAGLLLRRTHFRTELSEARRAARAWREAASTSSGLQTVSAYCIASKIKSNVDGNAAAPTSELTHNITAVGQVGDTIVNASMAFPSGDKPSGAAMAPGLRTHHPQAAQATHFLPSGVQLKSPRSIQGIWPWIGFNAFLTQISIPSRVLQGRDTSKPALAFAFAAPSNACLKCELVNLALTGLSLESLDLVRGKAHLLKRGGMRRADRDTIGYAAVA